MVWVPYFDADVGLDKPAEIEGISMADVDEQSALKAFLALTSADRLSDTRHVYAYYCDVQKAVANEDGRQLKMSAPESPNAIWTHVTPTQIYLEAGRNGDAHVYVVAECECDWEDEHGLMMVWRDGATLCKVSDFDGHITNVNAYDDNSLAEVVYPGIDKAFRTFVET